MSTTELNELWLRWWHLAGSKKEEVAGGILSRVCGHFAVSQLLDRDDFGAICRRELEDASDHH
jgi:hypothetical protein